MNSSGKAILRCPSCDKARVKIGSHVKRIHAIPRFIELHYWGVLVGWALISPVVLLSIGGPDMSTGLGWLGFMMIPVFAMYVLKRLYPVYRVTDCPYCGHHEKLKLGRAPDA